MRRSGVCERGPANEWRGEAPAQAYNEKREDVCEWRRCRGRGLGRGHSREKDARLYDVAPVSVKRLDGTMIRNETSKVITLRIGGGGEVCGRKQKCVSLEKE
jgi:hypothetical protein